METLLAQLLTHGLAAVAAASLIESLGAPVPALPVLLLAGSLAAEYRLPAAPLVLGSALGFWVGDLVWYAFGWSQGRRVLGLLCGLSLNPDACVGRADPRHRLAKRAGVRPVCAHDSRGAAHSAGRVREPYRHAASRQGNHSLLHVTERSLERQSGADPPRSRLHACEGASRRLQGL